MVPQDPNERRIISEEVVQTPTGTDAAVVENRVRVMPTPAERQLASLYRAKQILWFIVSIIVGLILLRFVLYALGANMTTGFGSFIDGLSDIFVAPFKGLFAPQGDAATGSYFEYASLIAIAVYLLLGWLISKLLEIIMAPRTPPTY